MTMSVKVLPRPVSADAPPAEHFATVTGALNMILVDSFALYLKTRRFGAFLSPPHLRSYGLLLDEQARQILRTTDGVVRRICEIDPYSLGAMGDVVRSSRFAGGEPHGPLHALLMTIRDDNLALGRNLGRIRPAIIDAGDLASLNLIDLWIDEAERRAEFLFEPSRL